MRNNDLPPEPQIGIEPMTAWEGTGGNRALSSGNESNRGAVGAQGTPEMGPKSSKSGNEVATSDGSAAIGYYVILGVLEARRRRAMQARAAARRIRRAA